MSGKNNLIKNKAMKRNSLNISARELEELARNGNFSQFEGEAVGDGKYYDGRNDDFMEFGGSIKSFLERQSGNGRIFVMDVTNTSPGGTDRNIILMPGYSSEGRPAGSVIITDGVQTLAPGETVTGLGKPKLIQNFLDFIQNHPTIVLGFKVRATNFPSQLDAVVNVRELSPFRTMESREIFMAAYQDEDTYQDKVVTVPEEIIACDQSEVSLLVLANEKVTITWFVGAILNDAVALKKKWGKAKYTKAALGQAQQAMNGK